MVHPPDSMAFQPLSSPGSCQRESYRFASALHVSPERGSSFKSLMSASISKGCPYSLPWIISVVRVFVEILLVPVPVVKAWEAEVVA